MLFGAVGDRDGCLGVGEDRPEGGSQYADQHSSEGLRRYLFNAMGYLVAPD
jgi:hypothetical protein